MILNHRSSTRVRVVLFLSMLFLTGCATTERVRLLEAKVAALEGRVETSTKDLYITSSNTSKKSKLFRERVNRSLSSFKKKYSPAVRAELKANLMVSNVHKERIAKLRRTSERDRNSIAEKLKDSERHLVVIKENEQTSTVRNVTNEFRGLHKKWNRISRKLERSVDMSSQASQLSSQSAAVARDSALAAQNNSASAVLIAEEASYKYRNLARKVHRAELDIQAIYAATDKAEHLDEADHNRLIKLAKELQYIKSKLKGYVNGSRQ